MLKTYTLKAATSALALGIAVSASAMDRNELKNVSPQIRDWFRSMRSPAGKVCCWEADGHRTRYDMRANQYWVPIDGAWQPVPPEAVIHGARSPFGDAVVWYRPEFNFEVPTGHWEIVCFVPSDDV
jgi:hypothetical protein